MLNDAMGLLLKTRKRGGAPTGGKLTASLLLSAVAISAQNGGSDETSDVMPVASSGTSDVALSQPQPPVLPAVSPDTDYDTAIAPAPLGTDIVAPSAPPEQATDDYDYNPDYTTEYVYVPPREDAFYDAPFSKYEGDYYYLYEVLPDTPEGCGPEFAIPGVWNFFQRTCEFDCLGLFDVDGCDAACAQVTADFCEAEPYDAASSTDSEPDLAFCCAYFAREPGACEPIIKLRVQTAAAGWVMCDSSVADQPRDLSSGDSGASVSAASDDSPDDANAPASNESSRGTPGLDAASGSEPDETAEDASQADGATNIQESVSQASSFRAIPARSLTLLVSFALAMFLAASGV